MKNFINRNAVKRKTSADTVKHGDVVVSRVLLGDAINADSAIRKLLDEREVLNIEFGIEWFETLAEHGLNPEEEASFVVLEQSGIKKAVLPVRISDGGARITSLSTFYSSIYMPIIGSIAPQDTLTTLTMLFSGLRELNLGSSLCLYPMDKKSILYEKTLEGLKSSGWKIFPYYCFGNWYLPLNGQSYDTYVQNLPSRVRNTINRKIRKFGRDERGRIELINTSESIDKAIEAYNRIYNCSWKVPEPYPEFVPSLIRLCAKKGWLRLGIAYYDELPIAAQIWIVAYGKAAIYKLAYDESYKFLSPGTLLTDYLMRHVMDVDKVSEIDYLMGDDAYKKDWMSHRRERWGVLAYNPSTIAGFIGVVWQYCLKSLKRIMTIPKT